MHRLQRCISHQIRASTRYVSYKDVKAFAAIFMPVYKTSTEESALAALDDFESKWSSKYELGMKNWRVQLIGIVLALSRIMYTEKS